MAPSHLHTPSGAPMALLGAGLLLALAGCAAPRSTPHEALAQSSLVVRTTDGSGKVTETRAVTPPPPAARRRTPPSAQPPARPDAGGDAGEQAGAERVMLNFVDADLAGVVRSLARFTQRNFLVDPRVKGKLTLVSETPVDARTAYDMLLGALRMQGYAVVDVDGVSRVLPEADAKLQGGAVTGGAAPASTGGAELVTRVFQLRFENAANLIPVLRPMIAPNNTITAYPGNNTLVISDYADNLDRIAEVIERIDVPSSFNTDIVPIEYGVALDVAALASQLLQSGRPGGDQGAHSVALVADPRSNSIIVRAPSQAQLELARDLIIRIDSPDSGTGNLHVVYLRNAQATHLAEVLRGVLTGQGGGSGGAASGQGLSGGTAQGAMGATAPAMGAGASRTNTSASAGLGGTSGLQGAAALGGAALGQAADQQSVAFSAGGATIQADPSTNTLIISAPDPLYRSLREVIDQLDQRRAQVLVESLIVEITAENAAEFGIQWSAGGGEINSGNTAFIGGANLGGSSLSSTTNKPLTTVDALGRGLSLGMVKGTVSILGNEVINLGLLARALQSQGGVNILSTPNLMTLDNEEASIMVGNTVPFTTGRYITSGDGAAANPFQTIEREDVGLMLRIRPQISEGGAVKMALYQEVSTVDRASSTSDDKLVTRKRALNTNVLVDDGQIIVLGGLIEDSIGDSTSAVPLLGDIPVLGELFRYNKRERKKTNLMVFLRPHIVRSARDSASLTLDRYNYMRNTQAALPSGSHWLLPAIDQPLLPAASLRPTDGLIDLRAPDSGARVPIETTTEPATGAQPDPGTGQP